MKKLLGLLFGVLFSIPAFATLPQAAINAGYTQVEYIESTGTQWIDTGAYITSNNLLVKTKAYSTTAGTSTEQDLFGNQDSTDGRIILGLSASNYLFIYTRYGTATASPAVTAPFAQNQIFNIETHIKNGQKWLVVDGVASGTETATNISNANKTVQLFANGKTNYFFNGRMYYFQMWDNDVLVRDFVPVKKTVNGTDVYGMYNVLDSNPETAFYGNAGTGAFIGGDPVANTCPGGTLQTYTTVAAADVPAPVQNGTPTPTNPITPAFYTQGNMVLRKVGDYADSYDATTGKITRRVGVKVLNGTENWKSASAANVYYLGLTGSARISKTGLPSTHYIGSYDANADMPDNSIKQTTMSSITDMGIINVKQTSVESLSGFKTFLAQQYDNGTPVKIYYVLATETTEDWAEESYCRPSIKIATRAYNTTQFAPVVTALNTAIDTIKDVVTNTINQTAAVSALQSTKQTRPDEECPAGKKCLLVEDVDGTPHWYVIVERYSRLPEGFTELQWIENTGTQVIDTGIILTDDTTEIKVVSKIVINEIPENGSAALYISTPNAGVQVYLYHTGTVYNQGVYKAVQTGQEYLIETITTATTRSISVNGDMARQSFSRSITDNSTLYSCGGTAVNASGKTNWKYQQIYKNGTLIRDFVPARRDSDGKVGMIDMADPNRTFYTDANGGNFTAGPVVQ